jgi:hypothetical protein
MAAALRGLAEQTVPSERGAGEMLDGLDVISDLVAHHAGATTIARARATVS